MNVGVEHGAVLQRSLVVDFDHLALLWVVYLVAFLQYHLLILRGLIL